MEDGILGRKITITFISMSVLIFFSKYFVLEYPGLSFSAKVTVKVKQEKCYNSYQFFLDLLLFSEAYKSVKVTLVLYRVTCEIYSDDFWPVIWKVEENCADTCYVTAV